MGAARHGAGIGFGQCAILARDDQRGETAEGRHARSLADRGLAGIETLPVTGRDGLQHRIVRRIGLDVGLGLCTAGDAAGTADDLFEDLKGALGRARIGTVEGQIRVDDADHRHVRKMMALGDKLGADDDVRLAACDVLQQAPHRLDARHEIARQHCDPRAGEPVRQFLGDPLDTRAAWHQRVLRTAIGAGRGHRTVMTAMVADQLAAKPVFHQPGRAVRAFEAETAFAAQGQRRIAAPVEEHQRLLAGFDGRTERVNQHGRQKPPGLGRMLAHVDEPHIGHAGTAETRRQPEMFIAAPVGIDAAFERRRGGGQHDSDPFEMPALHRHVAGVVGNAVFLLVGPVMLLIDNDEPQIGKGQKQRRARPDHHPHRARRDPAPDLGAHAAGDA